MVDLNNLDKQSKWRNQGSLYYHNPNFMHHFFKGLIPQNHHATFASSLIPPKISNLMTLGMLNQIAYGFNVPVAATWAMRLSSATSTTSMGQRSVKLCLGREGKNRMQKIAPKYAKWYQQKHWNILFQQNDINKNIGTYWYQCVLADMKKHIQFQNHETHIKNTQVFQLCIISSKKWVDMANLDDTAIRPWCTCADLDRFRFLLLWRQFARSLAGDSHPGLQDQDQHFVSLCCDRIPSFGPIIFALFGLAKAQKKNIGICMFVYLLVWCYLTLQPLSQAVRNWR